MEDLKKLQEIFRDVFDQDDLEITAETTSNDIEDWDSFAQINLIIEIENEFNIKFDLEEINDLKSIKNILKVIEKKGSFN